MDIIRLSGEMKMKAIFKQISRKVINSVLEIATVGIILLGATTSVMAAGLMTPVDSSKPALSIKSHHVNVTIEDGYAITEIDQTFSNPNQQDLEAIYSFQHQREA